MISPRNIFFLIQISIISSCSLQFKYREHTDHFEQEIQKLEELKDHLNKEDYFLFMGSSSIRRWETIEEDMAPYPVIKRGYGGAHYYDLIHFVDRLIEGKNKTSAVFLFVANDITGYNSWDKLHKDLTPNEIKKLFKVITSKIHKKLSPNIPIYVIETTPTPSRWKVWDKITQANDLIKEYTEQKPSLHFISTRKYFINKRGRPEGKYFVSDSLHLSRAGYDLWEEIIKNKLKVKDKI
jgi:hypothetical protein